MWFSIRISFVNTEGQVSWNGGTWCLFFLPCLIYQDERGGGNTWVLNLYYFLLHWNQFRAKFHTAVEQKILLSKSLCLEEMRGEYFQCQGHMCVVDRAHQEWPVDTSQLCFLLLKSNKSKLLPTFQKKNISRKSFILKKGEKPEKTQIRSKKDTLQRIISCMYVRP